MQAITVVATASDLSGYFFVGFEGHWSEKIAYDASADDVASALAGIPAVGEVNVSKMFPLFLLMYLCFNYFPPAASIR